MNSLPLTFLERPAQTAPGQQAWLLVLMHGVGSNEQDLFGLAPFVPPQFHVISLRAPFAMSSKPAHWCSKPWPMLLSNWVFHQSAWYWAASARAASWP